MARPALRKLDSAIDFSAHYAEIEHLPRPLALPALFGRDALTEIEVGSGKGMFLVQSGTRWRERNWLGIELSRKYACYVAYQAARRQLRNVLVIHGDGQRLFRDYLLGDVAAAVHVYFPDPWWKKRHKKRRLLNDSFLRDVERVLRPGGTLHIWTDVREYFDATIERIGGLTLLVAATGQMEQPMDEEYRTHFERRTRQAGEQVFRAAFQKRVDL